jgi:D-alanyl-D-alanine dipeptidase
MRQWLSLFAACVVLAPPLALGQPCPAALAAANRLALVTVPAFASSSGTLRLYERTQADTAWRLLHPAEPVVLGIRGVAWGDAFRDLARKGEPVKREGDGRTPAGVFAIGRPFGFAPASLRDYLPIKPETVCVNDPASAAYNTITARKSVGEGVSAENMRASALYRRGLVVNIPTNAAARAGSCIFIHIWRGPRNGTAGCVALPEERVAALQDFAAGHPSVLAIVPDMARDRFADCLPAIDAPAR